MLLWDQALSVYTITVDAAVMGVLIVLATVARRYIRLFQNYLVPNSLIAGFFGLILGPEILHWLPYDVDRMGVYVYHLLALLFIGMGFRAGTKRTRGSVGFGLLSILSYLIQATVGLLVTMSVAALFWPGLHPALGMLLPLGFGMGPGLAYSIGRSWESFGFEDGGSLGLAVAAVGFLVAYLMGVRLVRKGIRTGDSSLMAQRDALSDDIRTGIIRQGTPQPGAHLTFFSGAVEPLSVHVALIAAVYLATYLLVSGLAALLVRVGLEREVPLLWSFHFLAAYLVALIIRKLADRVQISYVLDAGLLNRITGLTADFMIMASVMAISLGVVRRYALPVALMGLFGAIATYFSLKLAVRFVFESHVFERFVSIFGEMTGTLSSGLALLRVTDPEFKTPVAEDLALGSGIALLFGFPLLFIINLPFTVFGGSLVGYWFVILACVLYSGVLYLIWRFGIGRPKD